MSITRKQFELGIDSSIEEWMRKLDIFLCSHKAEAFTDKELAKALGGFEFFLNKYMHELRPLFRLALEKLVEFGVAEKGKVGKEAYFAKGKVALDSLLSPAKSSS